MSSTSLIQSQIENFRKQEAIIKARPGSYKMYSQIPIGDEEKFTWFLRPEETNKYRRTSPAIYWRRKTKEEFASDELLVKNMKPGTSVLNTVLEEIPTYLHRYFDVILAHSDFNPNQRFLNKVVLSTDHRGWPVVPNESDSAKDIVRNSVPFVEVTINESNKNKYLKYKQKYLDLKKILNN
jgi:hypothetical protein